LGKGGESIVYRIEYDGLDEVVAKVSLKSEQAGTQLLNQLRETHYVNTLASDHVVEIKEEIIH
jgi:hypothetical protein